MKILAIVSILVLAVLAGSAFAAYLYWSHPHMGLIHHKEGHSSVGPEVSEFGGCPYLQKLHEGLEAPGGAGGEEGLNYYQWQEPLKNKDVIVI